MLGIVDRFLSLWIFLSMAAGLLLGYLVPNINNFWAIFEYNSLNMLLVVCLIIMMYPPLAKVEYAKMLQVFDDKKILAFSLFLNWIVGPSLMFILAYIFLRDQVEYMQGVIIIGLARCVAMVVVWSDLAKANREYTSALVAFNSVFQILFFGILAYFYLDFLPSILGIKMENSSIDISISAISKNVFIYLGIPFVLGFLSRFVLLKTKGASWYETKFLPFISPLTLITLLFTILMMCSYKSDAIFTLPLDTLKIALPLILYFVCMFFFSWFISRKNKINYEKTCSISFSASGNNFELAIAICIASFGIASPQSFGAIIGPLVEVPVLVLLVKWALKNRY
ncbi:ACR3 family arsenite efflux transporter [Helicobacter trogontum]|uniref:ACR3 family arsenite efflux transporter n=1 Tax=Helicobacter trogontum TaxID=50960 RepID=A0A4U8S965_9HELI|nr:ACR3 family arsenite efflux transporter [Helicobacter trogontum]TLD82524.1 ACR3 family arsenite efflux transporter [Helicobacter trogontum]